MIKHKWLFIVALVAVVLCALAVPCFAYPMNITGSPPTLAPSSFYLLSHDDIEVSYGPCCGDVSNTYLSIDDGYELEFYYEPVDVATKLSLSFNGREDFFSEFAVTYPYMSLRPDESVAPVTTLVFSPAGGGGQEVVNMYREYTFYYYNQSGELLTDTYLESRTYDGELVNFPVPLIPSYMPAGVVGIELSIFGDTSEGWDTLTFTEPELSDTPYQYGPNLPEHNVTIVTSPNVFEWLSNSIGALLDTPIMGDPAGDYSYTIGNLLFLVVCIPLVVSFLKLFAGG